MSAIYEGRDLVQRYGDREALHLQSLSIEAGETVFLTGPNGSGKSTLLRMLALLERPFSGSLHFDGTRMEVSLLLQEPYLLKMSVWNNVLLGRRLRHLSGNENGIYADCMQAVGFAEPEAFAKRGPRQLSGGERQRVALAARLALEPRVLLLDEPTANVDAKSARAIAGAMRHAQERGVTVVCSTHDPALMRALTSTITARELPLGKFWDEESN